VVRGIGDMREFEHAGIALDGVHVAEQRGNHLRIAPWRIDQATILAT
jgi:hypothetical protein